MIPCGRGIPPYLADELRGLGFPILREQETGVETTGSLDDAMRLNLCLRTGQRVLYQLERFQASTPDQMYHRIRQLPWEEYIPATGYVRVASFVRTAAISDARFATLKCKDAIVDRIRERCGRRPDSGSERHGAAVFLYWNERDCAVYLDTSGESLARRTYRKIPLEAPMQETLAAAVVQATGWTGDAPFINPMCGSGTLAIEAALLGLGRPPGLLRGDFAFMHLNGFDPARWHTLREGLRRAPKKALAGRIVASDVRPEAVRAAQQNARTAGVEQVIDFHVGDFADTPLPEGAGVIVLNPEYGERMGQAEALEPVYRRIGDFFKQRCQGYAGWVFTGNLDLAKRVGLRSRRRILFFNGELECRLLKFEIYAGSLRHSAAAGPAGQAGTAPPA